MNTTTTTRPRRITTVLAALALSLLSMMALAGPASAYTITSRSSVPVPPTVYRVQGAHYDAGQAVTGPMYKPWIYQAGPVVNRTASGTQHVSVRYMVDRWDGSVWRNVANQTKTARIDPGYTAARVPALSVLPGGSGHYRVRLAITYTSAIGGVQGSMTINMNHSGDYVCSTNRTCRAGAGSVFLGA